MTRTTQEQFLSSVRAALGKPTTGRPTPPQIDDDLIRVTKPSAATMVDDWGKAAAAVGMMVRRCTAASLATMLVDLLREIDARDAAVAIDRLPQAPALKEAIKSAGVSLLHWQNDRTMDKQYEVSVGITDVHCAIVETGSFVCWSDADHGRGQSLVPPLHIAIVRKSDIVPDLVDYFQIICDRRGADLPSAQAIITGPSKTADIEGVLITGVHGPAKVFVLLVEDA